MGKPDKAIFVEILLVGNVSVRRVVLSMDVLSQS